ncbi:MAG: 4-hydroxy-tetrahydrodipicolinate synthase [Burkholderiaceae bacterium]|nr:4-hydroxy-tetrahydrodipicolinate synthase [Burkholderiaceae bacterium]MCD8537538.1 4-hydroxy-tetrahydrodipicolinate synthase [Burkholderiaceae bacterium]
MKTQGILVPIVTPFTKDNQVNLPALKALAEVFIQKGVTGIVACGTTGEYYTLNAAERTSVLKCVAEVGRGRITLIAGINDVSTQGAIERAKEAEALGYEGLMLAPPSYSLPGQAELQAHYEAVATATRLPIIMYNFPARVGVEIEIDTVVELAKLPNIVGIKESSGNFSRALALIHLNLPGFEVISGCDDQAADFLFWGVRSWISGGANVFPGEQTEMVNAAIAGDWAKVKSLMTGMMPIIQNMESGNYNQKAKLGCRRHGIDVGQVRLPLLPAPTDEAQAFIDLIDAYDKRGA